MGWREIIRNNALPLLLAAFSTLLYYIFAYHLVRSDFLRLISLVASLFIITYFLIKSYGWNFWLLAGIGIFFRLLFLPAIPNLSQDFYRFLWDGNMIVNGLNPYLYTPEAILTSPELISGEIPHNAQLLKDGMGALSASHFSNYPPVNQFFFGIAALLTGKSILGSVIVLRILIILADLGTLYFGSKLLKAMDLPVTNIFWYFLNPFIIIELTGNLHFEGVMLCFLVWSLYLLLKKKWVWSAILFGVSISVKLIPLLLLPLLMKYMVKRTNIKNGILRLSGYYALTLIIVLFSFLPFLSSDLLTNFSSTLLLWFQNFEFNGSIYYIIRWIGFQTIGWNIIADVGKILPLVVILCLLLLALFRRNSSTKELLTAMLFGVSIYFLLSTTIHPWYVATPLILTIFTKYRYAVVWSLLVMLSYAAYTAEGFSENLWLVAFEYISVVGFAIWELFFRRKKTEMATAQR